MNTEKTFRGGTERMPKSYAEMMDPFTACMAAAAVTKRLTVGTGIYLVPQHAPIVLAKTIATLDVLSEGRFILGMGGGWNVGEMNNHGVVYETRFAQLREHVLAMKALWTEEDSEYHGEYVDFSPVWCYPKPMQKPHPPRPPRLCRGGPGGPNFLKPCNEKSDRVLARDGFVLGRYWRLSPWPLQAPCCVIFCVVQ